MFNSLNEMMRYNLFVLFQTVCLLASAQFRFYVDTMTVRPMRGVEEPEFNVMKYTFSDIERIDKRCEELDRKDLERREGVRDFYFGEVFWNEIHMDRDKRTVGRLAKDFAQTIVEVTYNPYTLHLEYEPLRRLRPIFYVDTAGRTRGLMLRLWEDTVRQIGDANIRKVMQSITAKWEFKGITKYMKPEDEIISVGFEFVLRPYCDCPICVDRRKASR